METPTPKKTPKKKPIKSKKTLGFEVKVKRRVKDVKLTRKSQEVKKKFILDPAIAPHISDKQLEFLELYIPMYFNATKICQEIGMARSMYTYWIDSNPHFKQAIDECREYMVELAEEVMRKSVEKENASSAQFILKTLGRKKGYSESLDITSNGQTILPAVITIVNPLSTADDFIKILKPDEETKPE
jgi:hypothetical protein